MRSNRRPSIGRPTTRSRTDKREQRKSGQLDESARRLNWTIAAIGARLEEVNGHWAEAIGVSGPQWMILMAVDHLKATASSALGVPVREVAARLEVDPSFVASQSKQLEKAGFLDRPISEEDSRVILLALTASAQATMLTLEKRQSALNKFIYEDFSPGELDDLVSKLAALLKRLEKAGLRLELDA